MRKKRPRKKFKLRYLLISILVIIAAGFAVRSYSSTPLPDPTPPCELLQQFFAYIETGEFAAMYQMLTTVSQDSILLADFIERNRNIYEGILAENIAVTITEITTLPERPGRRFVDYTISMDTLAGEVTHSNQAIFELNEENEFRLQWSSHTIFPELRNTDRVRVSILPAQRGQIFDRNGVMLAGPGTASAVGFVPGRMREEEKHDDIAKVAELLEMTPEAVIRRLGASYVRDDTFVLLRTISREAQDLIDELLTVQGIMVSTAHVRYYPLGRRAAHLVGYIQNINAEELEARRGEGYHMNSVIGRAGLESIYEQQLRARDGREIFIVDEDGNRTTRVAILPPENGENIHLTIDAYIQNRLYEQFSADKSASVAMNPLTGEVLALVSTPSYDPNDFVRGMTTSIWTGLNEDENLPLFNRFRATFSPGSTMKAITAAIGVDADIFHPSEDFGPSGLSWQRNESWGRFFVTTVQTYSGPANLNNAMAWSDNIYFAKATLRIGAEIFADGLTEFGFGERIPFEYGLFSSTISRTGAFASDIQLADSGYGQGEVLMNPVHLAAIYASFVNNGNILEPQLILGRTPEVWRANVFSPTTANAVLDSLIYSIDVGTGRPTRIPGVTLAGKTGTAEIKLTQDDTTGRELGWFVLLTVDEIENPLLIVSMVEDVQDRGGSGYVVARVGEIMREHLR